MSDMQEEIKNRDLQCLTALRDNSTSITEEKFRTF